MLQDLEQLAERTHAFALSDSDNDNIASPHLLRTKMSQMTEAADLTSITVVQELLAFAAADVVARAAVPTVLTGVPVLVSEDAIRGTGFYRQAACCG